MIYSNKITDVVFFNSFGNGDIHYSRQFIKDIIKKLKDKIFIGKIKHNYVKNNYRILKDIEDIQEYSKDNLDHLNEFEIFYDESKNTLYVNTWIGSSYRQFLANSCSLKSNYIKYKKLYDLLSLQIEKIEHYIPEINWELLETKNINDFFSNRKVNVLICNGPVMSSQSLNFDFNQTIRKLSELNKEINFILTDKTFPLFLENVYYTKDIIQLDTFDLNEISYISKFCDLIVGRASGPFCYCHTKNTLYDKSKIFISFCYQREEGLWVDHVNLPEESAKQLWSQDFSEKNVYEIILNSINEIKK